MTSLFTQQAPLTAGVPAGVASAKQSYQPLSTATDADSTNNTDCNDTWFQSSVLAWASMILGVLSGSTIGPIFKFVEQRGVGAMMAASWRNQAMLVFLIPLALVESKYEVYAQKQQVSMFSTPHGLRYPLLAYVLMDGVAWAVGSSSWVVALQYTTTVRASVFASLSPIVLALYQYCAGGQVSLWEWAGVLGAFVGTCVIISDGAFDSEGHSAGDMLLGDGLCLLASFAFSFEILNRKNTCAYVHLFKYSALTTIMVVVCTTLGAIALEGGYFVGGLTSSCIFGWLNRQWIKFFLLFGFGMGVVCLAGYNYAMATLSPLIFSTVALIDPALTGIMSWMFGIERLPDWRIWLGGTIVMAGVGFISYGESKRHVLNPPAPVEGELDVAYTPCPLSESKNNTCDEGVELPVLYCTYDGIRTVQ